MHQSALPVAVVGAGPVGLAALPKAELANCVSHNVIKRTAYY